MGLVQMLLMCGGGFKLILHLVIGYMCPSKRNVLAIDRLAWFLA